MSDENDNVGKLFKNLFGAPGPTGEFPDGKINEGDEGEIGVGFGVHEESGTVVARFGRTISWIGFTPEQAESVAGTLIKLAQKAREIRERLKDGPAGKSA